MGFDIIAGKMYCHVSPCPQCHLRLSYLPITPGPGGTVLYFSEILVLGIFPYKGMSHFQGGHIKWGTSNWGTYLTCSLIKWRLCCIDDYPWWLGYINSSYLWRRTTQLLYDEIIPELWGLSQSVLQSQRSVFIPKNSGWWFQSWLSFSIIYIWDNPSHWLIFF